MDPPLRTKQETRAITIRIVLLAFILFFNSTSTTYLYSFLPDMMVDFGLVESKSDSGKYASWLASGFFFGRFISASFWGIFIDKYGRKAGLLTILASVSFLTLLFGFSTSFTMALIIRTITGLFNGLSIVGKTLSTEICPPDLKPWSISVTNTIWALGMTVGPGIGSLFFRVIDGYPYLMSATVVCLLGCLMCFLSYVFMEETLTETKKKQLQEERELIAGGGSAKLADQTDEEADRNEVEQQE
mmetsp:Transcript_24469/g.21647  ORF Transcript_24469/g.21647 Transcript_24469/m.21647 type:complete len:244 (+) Transcript_24469:75-806(+)